MTDVIEQDLPVEDSELEEQAALGQIAGSEESKEEDKAQDTDKSHLIPRHRYNYQRDRRIEAENQANQLREELSKYQQYLQYMQQQQAQPQGAETQSDYESRLSELDAKIEEARTDGDVGLAAKLRAEQRRLERDMMANEIKSSLPQNQANVDQRQVIQRASDSLKLEQTIDRLEKQYPMLDETNESFDGELSDEIMNLYSLLVHKMPTPNAMERAVSYVTKAHGISPVGTTKGTNVARNVRAAASQPPELSSHGFDSSARGVRSPVDVMKMSQDDFEKLGDTEIEKLLARA
jgi:hypothetical protein